MADEVSVLSLIGDAESLMAALDETEAGINTVVDSLGQLEESAAGLTSLDEVFAQLSAMTAEGATAFQELDASLSEVAGAASEAATAIEEVGAAAESATSVATSSGEAAAAMDEEATAASDAASAVQEKASAEKDAAAATQENADATKASATAAAESGTSWGSAAMGMGLVATATGMATKSLLDMGSQAQDSMQTLFDLTGASQKDIATYSSGLQGIAMDIGVTMNQAAQGMYYVASAGYNAANGGMYVLTEAMKAAKGGGADMMTVSDALTSAMRAYGASAQQAGQYSDLLIGAVSQGKQTFQDLAAAIGPAAVTGKLAGVSFKEVASAEALMTQQGFDAHRAVMDLDFLMRAVGVNIATVAKNAKSMGLSFDETKFSSMDLHDKLMYLQDITKGNTAEFEKLVGGANGLAAASILMGHHGKDFANMLQTMGHEAGVTEQAFAGSEQTMSAHWAHLGATISVIALQIVNALTPTIGPLLDKLGAAFQWVADMITHHLSEAMPVLIAFGTFIGGTLIAGIGALAVAFLAPAAPIIGIIALISGLVGGVVLLVQHWHQVTSALNNIGIFHAIGEAFQTIGHYVGLAIDAFKQVFFPIQAVHDAAKPLLDTFDRASGIIPKVTQAAKPLTDTFDRAKSAVFGIHGVMQPLLDSFDRATGVFHSTGQAVNPFVSIFKGLAQVFQAVAHAVGSVLQDVGGGLKASFLPVWQELQQSFQRLMPLFKQLWDAIQPLAPVFVTLAEIVGGVLVLALGVLVGIITGLVKGLAYALSGIIQVIGGIVRVFTGLVQIISGVMTLLYDIITGNWSKIGDDLKRIGQGILNVISGLWETITGVFRTAWGLISGLVGGFVQGVIGFFQHLFDAIVGHSLIPDMVAGILDFFKKLITEAPQLIWGMIVHILTLVGTWELQMLAKAGDLVSQFVGFLASLPGKVHDIFLTLINSAASWMLDFGRQLLNGLQQIPGMIGGALQNIAGGFAHLLGFSKPDQGPLANVDQWMPDFGTLLSQGLNAQVAKVKGASLNIATAISASPSATSVANYSNAVYGAPSNSQMVGVLQQILAELQRGNQQASRNNIGPAPLNANYAAINQYTSNSFSGIAQSELFSLYHQLNTMAGYAQQNASRGATAGLG